MKRSKNSKYNISDISAFLERLSSEKKTHVQHRRIVALLLLHVTGLKPDVLILLKKKDIATFFDEGFVHIQLQPFGLLKKVNVDLYANSLGVQLLKKYRVYFEWISEIKTDSSYVFSSEENSSKTLSLEVFERDLLKTIKDFS